MNDRPRQNPAYRPTHLIFRTGAYGSRDAREGLPLEARLCWRSGVAALRMGRSGAAFVLLALALILFPAKSVFKNKKLAFNLK